MAICFMEVNVPGGRVTNLRADRIVEVREDYVQAAKGGDKVPVIRLYLEGGANVVVIGETAEQVWTRLSIALNQSVHRNKAPKVDDV